MSRFALLSPLLVAFALVGVATEVVADDETALRQHADTWLAHYKAGDLDALMALYEDDAIVTLHDQPGLFGIDAIRAYFAAGLGKNDVTFDIEHELVEVNGNIGHVIAKYWLSATNRENGYVYRDAGRSLLIYKRGADGEWRIAVDIDQTTPDVKWPEKPAAPVLQ
ncbi:MAG: DUF4440 domain-containing protein [Pseudomonadota bacterium]